MRALICLFFALPLLGQPSATILSPPRDTLFFEGSSVFLQAFGDAGLTYRWSLSTGRVLEGSPVSFTARGDRPITITMVAEDGNGNETEPATRIIYPAGDLGTLNLAPEILSINPSSTAVNPGTRLTATAEIRDPDEDEPFTYNWFWIEDDRARRFTGEVFDAVIAGPAANSDSITLSLIVRDGRGHHTFPSQISITVREGNLPPTVRIVAPAEETVFLVEGDSLELRAETADPEGDPVTLTWNLPSGMSAQNPVTVPFDSAGRFFITAQASDSEGNTAPTDGVTVTVFEPDEIPPPEASIAYPSNNPRLFEGDALPLVPVYASGTGSWEITNAVTGAVRTIDEENPGRVLFPEQGLFSLRFRRERLGVRSEDDDFNFRWVTVHRRDANRAPTLSYPEHLENVIFVRNEDEVDLSMMGTDPDEQPLQWFWVFEGTLLGGQGNARSFTVDVDDDALIDGTTTLGVRVQAVDPEGKAATVTSGFSLVVYEETRPPRAFIGDLGAVATEFLALGEAFPLIATIENPDQAPINDVYWSAKYVEDAIPFFTSTQLEPGDLVPPRAGLIDLTLQVNAFTEGSAGFAGSAYLHVYDPALAPRVQIVDPSQDAFRAEVGVPFRVEGLITDPNFQPAVGSRVNEPVTNAPTWTLAAPDVIPTTLGGNPLFLSLQTPGTFTLTLDTENSLGLTNAEPAAITIEVSEPLGDAGTEPNDTRAQAGDLMFGNYSELGVGPEDPVDWYRFTLENAGDQLSLTIDLTESTESVDIEVFQGERLVSGTRLPAGERSPFRFVGGDAGDYFLRIAAVVEPTTGKRAALSYGFNVSVSVPTLLFPHVRQDAVEETLLTLVNPLGSTVTATFVAHDETGVTLRETPITLAPKARYEADLGEIFSGLEGALLAWVSVRADGAILGMSTTRARDRQTAVAEWAGQAAIDQLVVPHIAQRTDQWYTRAAIANAGDGLVTTLFSAAAGDFPVNQVSTSKQGATLDFETFFGGTLPTGSEWGRFVEASGQASLAGFELFGTRQGSPRQAGLRLESAAFLNPNFTYVNRDIIFPHVAKDINTFWTGVAFVNTNDSVESVRLVAYTDDGTELAAQVTDLAPFEKRVDLARAMFEGLEPDAPVSWIRLETTGSVSGYALFGDNTGDDKRLAGLPAIGGGSREVSFLRIPYEHWNGIAAVNLSPDTVAELTYEAYAEDGSLIETVAGRTIGPYRKEVIPIETLFGGTVPGNLAWLRLTSTQPLAAFQLFGDDAGNYMAGATAQ